VVTSHDRELSVTIPLDRMGAMIAEPVVAAGRVLSSRGGLPIYVGLGVLAAADLMSWPLAAAAGVGYAVLRRLAPRGGRSRPEVGRPGTLGPARAADRSAQPAGTTAAGTRPARSGRTASRTPASRAVASRAVASRAGASRAGASRAGVSRAGASRAGHRRTGTRPAGA
jgi:hypothetical protein